jgi:hypothetical protein
MCSIVLRIAAEGVFIGANRDELLARPWEAPAEFWPGVIGGRDSLAGGTWLGVNRHGVMAAVLNRTGTLGPAVGKRSRGELPLLALQEPCAADAAARFAALDAGLYRSFNLVVADAGGGFLVCGLEGGQPVIAPLASGVTMITSGAPNDVAMPRIARHLPRFRDTDFSGWGELLADESGAWDEALNIPERDGFGTVCSSLISITNAGLDWKFCGGRPGTAAFEKVGFCFSAGSGCEEFVDAGLRRHDGG